MPHMTEEKHPDDFLLGLSTRCEHWRSKLVESICSQKAFREGPRLLIKTALGVVLFMSLIYSWYLSRISGDEFSPEQFSDTYLNANESEAEENTTGGLRMVVFGGGDVATPSFSDIEEHHAWTEIMCHELECDSYITFIPKVNGTEGTVMSNPLLAAAYKRLSSHDMSTTLDYSWVSNQYPKPNHPDLASQVHSFLSLPKPPQTFTETLWVFNIGYWDIWYLAALPRKLATNVLDSSARDLFFQIERLYQAAQDEESIAFSDYYSDLNESTRLGAPFTSDNYPRAPFRIFLTRLFDISLTPGFASVRPEPPGRHSRSDQLRNAAFLTKYWNTLLELTVDDWLTTPDPDFWSATDAIDIEVVKALVGKESQGMGEHEPIDDEKRGYSITGISLPLRSLASYGMASYLQELMIDRQLRNTELYDHNGLGARPPESGFEDISMPCALPVLNYGDVGNNETEEREETVVVCQEPDDYLFYTELILGQRAIREIGTRAAQRFLEQVEPHSKWTEKANLKREREIEEEEEREREREREMELELEKERAQEGYQTVDFAR